MSEPAVHRAIAASAVGLVAAIGCVALLLPPWVAHTVASVERMAAVAVGLAASMTLHWVALARAARRLERPAAAWVALSVLLFPVGSALALIVLGWFRGGADEGATQRPRPTRRPAPPAPHRA